MNFLEEVLRASRRVLDKLFLGVCFMIVKTIVHLRHFIISLHVYIHIHTYICTTSCLKPMVILVAM